MVQVVAKTSFASGEWAPKLRSRVDIQKFHSGAALMRNFFVDYAGGGASTRQGTRFINQAKALGARLIPFQPSSNLAYVLEFGQNYIRFYSNGAPIVEAGTTISGVTQANPGVVTDTAHGYSTGDWVLITQVVGMTQLNGNYYVVTVTSANTYTLTDLFGNVVNTTGFGAYVSGGIAQRVYTITSPYNTIDLFPNQQTGNPGLKFVQNVTSLIITHPSYTAQQLVINNPTSWTLSSITFAATIASPATPTVTTSATGTTWFYAYVVTAVDVNGQESGPSVPGTVSSTALINSASVTNTVSWTAVVGAVSYNVYKALPAAAAIVSGAEYGFIGNVTGTSFQESTPGIAADFSLTPPIIESPFVGSGVTSYTVTAAGSYAGGSGVPTVSVAPPGAGVRATAQPSFQLTATGTINHAFSNGDIGIVGGANNPNGFLLTFTNGISLKILSSTFITNSSGVFVYEINSVSIANGGSFNSGTFPSVLSPLTCNVPNFADFATLGGTFSINMSTFGLNQVVPIVFGSGYTSAPAVTLSSGTATATANLGPAGGGNPGVPGFIQQRLALAGQPQNIQGFNFSQPSSFYNFNTSNPTQDSDAISGTIISEDLNDIRWLVAVPTGIIAGTGKGAWLINGGGGISTQVPITPQNVTAQPQAFNGANDLKPLKVNFDLLYNTNKGNYVRDLSYNLYAQIFTGSDISVLSNHLFFGFSAVDWCFAEEPFKTAWIVRNDGQILSLGYVKEQDLIGFAHHDTNGQFKSVCSVIETTQNGVVDAVYVIVQRLVDGVRVQYVERMADRYFPYGYEDSWSVDAALQTVPVLSMTTGLTIDFAANVIGNGVELIDGVGTPFTAAMAINNYIVRAGGGIYQINGFISSSAVTAIVVRVPSSLNQYDGSAFPVQNYTIWQPVSSVSGLQPLTGESVVGVADGAVVGPFTVPASGVVSLGLTATKVTLGLAFTPQLQTLPLDLGEPTVQGKRKRIAALTLRVADTLGLQVGKTFSTLVTMKDFQIGAIPSTTSGIAKITDLVNPSIAPQQNIIDGRTIIDQQWESAGNYCVQQNLPYPATILGIFPEVQIGDT